MNRAWRIARSRRLAIGLIVGFVLYAIMATLTSHGNWEVPYGKPFFLILTGLLATSTAACALERTQRTLRISRSLGFLSDGVRTRLRARPDFTVSLALDADPDAALTAAADTLTHDRMSVSRSAHAVDGVAGRANLWGSPLFHWALVALMLVVVIGRTTRSEGFMGLPVGERVPDVHASYLQVEDGSLFGERHSRVEFLVSRVERNHVENGVAYGPTPFVTAYRNGVAVASGWVRPNRPLITGALMLHMVALGPAVQIAAESPGGAQRASQTLLFERSHLTSSGTAPQVIRASGLAGQEPIKVRVQVIIRRPGSPFGDTTVSRAIIETASVNAAVFGPPVVVPEGQAVDLGSGRVLRVVDVKDWVRVSVANDWSVNAIYGLLVLAILGLAIAVLLPTRRVSILLIQGEDDTWSLHGATWHSQRSPSFSGRVADAVREAAETQEHS